MKQIIFSAITIALLLVSGCGKSNQVKDDSMLVSTSDSVSAQQVTATTGYTIRAAPEYTIRKGDTLWSIAERRLGSGRRYHEILELNPSIRDVTNIQVGTRIQLPAM